MRQDKKGKFWYDGEFNNVLFKTPPIEDDGVAFNGYSQFTVKVDPANRRGADPPANRQGQQPAARQCLR